MVSESALFTPSLTRLGHALDQVLRFLQAQARELADDLDDADLLVGRVFLEGDRELGLLFDRGSGRGGSATQPAAIATGAAAVTPNFFSMSEMSSTTCITVMLEIASRISSFETAI